MNNMSIRRYLKMSLMVILMIVIFGVFVRKTFNTGKTTKSVVKTDSVKEIGNLEVLSASVNLGITETFDNDKAAFQFKKEGTAVYSVNLEKIEVSIDPEKKRLYASIPIEALSVTLYVDESSTEKVAEYQERGWTGNAETGYRKHLEMTTDGYEKIMQSLQNSSNLKTSAIVSAEEQIRMLIEASLIDNEYEVVVNVMRNSK